MTLAKLIRACLYVATSILVASCGGGGGSSGGSSGGAVVTPTFSLGGNVSGLVGEVVFQVVVSNSGNTSDTTNTATITGNGAFITPAFVPKGGSFIVLVATQPSGQICTISNGSGTNIVANLKNINVVCSAQTFSVSVTASGLLPGQKVVLENNSDNRANKVLAINANSTFTFADPVALGSGYSVTIYTEPLVTTCTISNSSGSNVSANISNVSLTCGPATADDLLYSFGASGSDAINPEVGLLQGVDGVLYGVTGLGQGTSQLPGLIYGITTSGVEHVVYSFADSPDGRCPQAPLIQASDGNFYGTTCLGGLNGNGTIYMLTPSGGETVLHSFNAAVDGDSPFGALIQANDGNLYGTTSGSGAHGYGTAFKIGLGGTNFSLMYSFGVTGGDAKMPHATLIQGADDNLYGTTMIGGAYGYGTVFQLNIANGNVTVIHSFGNPSTTDGNMAASAGHKQAASLVQYSDGYLYGTTPTGGLYNDGTVFKLTISGTPYSVLYSFGSVPSDGLNSQAALLLANDGYFYGTTVFGGSNDYGTIFRITPDGSENVMYSFGAGDGENPVGALIQAKDGHLYGTTSYGGHYNDGIVFKF